MWFGLSETTQLDRTKTYESIFALCNPVLHIIDFTGPSQYEWPLKVHCAQLGSLSYMEPEQKADSVTSSGRRSLTGTLRDGKLRLQAETGLNVTVCDGVFEGYKFPAMQSTPRLPINAAGS